MNAPTSNFLYSASSGTTSTSPFIEFFSTVSPTIYDVNFPIKKRWYNTTENLEFMLVSYSSNAGFLQANWVLLNSSVTPSTFTWQEITSSETLIVNNGYVTNSATLINLTLPSTAALGDIISIVGKGSGGWSILQNASQEIKIGSAQTTITTGSVSSSNDNDCIELVATTAGTSTVWTSKSWVGNLTVI